jgi:hypothetical protein
MAVINKLCESTRIKNDLYQDRCVPDPPRRLSSPKSRSALIVEPGFQMSGEPRGLETNGISHTVRWDGDIETKPWNRDFEEL